MPADPVIDDKKTSTFDPEYQTENIAFDLEKMIDCGGCGRTNPPNRLNCIYCGGELDVEIDDSVAIKTHLRRLELWEHGFNVILKERTDKNADTRKIASFLSMSVEDLRTILDAGCALPLARIESEKEAAIIINRLAALGLSCSMLRDDALSADKPPVRLSRIEIVENSYLFTDFNTGRQIEIARDDLALIVPGTLTSGKVDSLEKKRRGKESKILDETTTTDDEALLDIYSRNDSTGFRIRMTGFDFSCLEKNKSLLAAENMRSLIGLLQEQSPGAKLVNDYAKIRHALGIVWEIESRKDSKGLQRVGFGKTEFGAVASTNNLNQFTKYSRLQWHLL